MTAAQSGPPTELVSALDHLVVVAHSLDQGVEWCLATLGVAPGPGGRHELMATHNRLLKIAAPRWPEAYLEIIAIDPDCANPPANGRARWFGIDDPALRQQVAVEPRLVHFVAQTSGLQLARARLTALGEDVGQVVGASRKTPDGELRWQITLRDDGVPQHGGALPALIAWQGRHPTAAMTDAGLRLRSLRVCSNRSPELRKVFDAIGLGSVELMADAQKAAALEAVFETPRGEVKLSGGYPMPSGGNNGA